MKKELGKYFIDISKLIFAGVLLAGLIRQDINSALLFSLGAAVFLLTAFYVFFLVRRGEQDENAQKK